MSAAGYAASCAAIRDMDQSDTINRIAQPTLAIVGEHDLATPPSTGALITQKIEAFDARQPAGGASLQHRGCRCIQ